MPLKIHIINHTHWDREWFLTHIYTNALIPGLVDRIESLVADNPTFQYLFDGQTLIIEDLLKSAPQYKSKVEALVRQGNLIIVPYYCQPDWKMTCGEALIRNLLYGQQDSSVYGSLNDTGWLVDTFGHISQAPQLHGMFGIQTVYVWRGVPLLEPYLHWQSPDNSTLLTINLFGGYRNLYGITHVPEVATQRLVSESRRLQPYYPTPDVPLFDGYDLEDNPEDPVRFFQQHTEIPPNLALVDSTPRKFAGIARSLPDIPTIQGELNSGKYGATFPGTLSARTYLKVMAHDCEHWLFRVCEPLAALASLRGYPYPGGQFEGWARDLLQNAIHDCLCGVSIDLVHEKMAFTYHQVFENLQVELAGSLASILGNFAPGVYAVSSNPYPYEGWQVVKDRLMHVKTNGVGVWPVGKSVPTQAPEAPVATFARQNEFYIATVQGDGVVQVGGAKLGTLLVSTETGDTYSEEPGELLGLCRPEAIYVEERSERHCRLRLEYAESWGEVKVSATVRLTLDQSPLIHWTILLDSLGTDFRVEMVFESGHRGQIYAGMPFDIIKRPATESDLLPRELPSDLAGVLLGQREVGEVRSFPFHDFVAISNENETSGLFARGLHCYQAEENGRISIVLRRAVEWLTRPELCHRVGDAGPFFYVPDARCERPVQYELAFFSGSSGVTDVHFQQLNAGFQNPPVLVQSQGNGEKTKWQFFQENLPLDNL
jgi:alpha-mannosidase